MAPKITKYAHLYTHGEREGEGERTGNCGKTNVANVTESQGKGYIRIQ